VRQIRSGIKNKNFIVLKLVFLSNSIQIIVEIRSWEM
jgi:hypothetical protein